MINWKKDEFTQTFLSSPALRTFFFLTSLIVLGSTYHQLVHHFKTLKMLTLLQTVLLGNDPVTLNIQP